jgi:DUF438 domain-containing protein
VRIQEEQSVSKNIDNSKFRKAKLKGLILKLHAGESQDSIQQELVQTLGTISYGDVVEVEQELLEEGLPQEEVGQDHYFCRIRTAALAID